MKNNNLSQDQKDLLIGSLLGNASLQTENGQTWRVRFIHRALHLPYIEHKYQIMKDFCETGPKYSEYFDERTNKTYNRYYLNTITSDKFRYFANKFYKHEYSIGSKKYLPTTVIHDLTPKALAYWYMDSGALKWVGKSNAVRFCTDAFEPHHVIFLNHHLKEKFNLKCSIQKKDKIYRIGIAEESYPILKDLIYPHLLPCMYYKFPDGNKGVLHNEDISDDVRNTFKN